MRRERLIRPTKACRFNILQNSRRYCYGLQVFSWSGFPDCRHARHSAVRRCFFIPSAIFTPLPDYAVTHRTARLTSALHTPPVPACASSRRESPFLFLPLAARRSRNARPHSVLLVATIAGIYNALRSDTCPALLVRFAPLTLLPDS